MAADINTKIGVVRYKIGDVSEPYYLPDNVIQYNLDLYSTAKTEAIQIWKASIDSIDMLIAQFTPQGGRIREREGSVEKEQYGNQILDKFYNLRNWLLKNPPAGIGLALHRFGGTFDKPPIKGGWYNDKDFTPRPVRDDE